MGALSYQTTTLGKALPVPTPTPVVNAPTPTPTQSKTTTRKDVPPVQDPSRVLGVEGTPGISYTGISWVRLGYPSCGWGNLRGKVLQETIRSYHKAGVRVLLTVCQGPNEDKRLYDTKLLNDAAQGLADAVQCGNEQMKRDQAVSFLYIPPERFARFYDLCERAVHAVRPEIPVLLGSLDPHVGGVDYQPLVEQVQYLDQMQSAMNTKVRPGSNWNWRKQTLGLIDSWHNGWNTGGYPDETVNSLAGLFTFWADQFQVNLNSGQLGKHIWVVEGTGCFKGCGINTENRAHVAISHILTLIIDVQTAMKYKVPFFYFSGKDFMDQGLYWPIGILDDKGMPKPLRQDLTMGSRSLEMSCARGKITVVDQLQLLVRLYERCGLPGNYLDIIAR
jgi:hypothetical protein